MTDATRMELLRKHTRTLVDALFGVLPEVALPGWSREVHAVHVARSQGSHDRIVASLQPMTGGDLLAWLARYSPALINFSVAYSNGYPADAYQKCESCQGTVEPYGVPHLDEGDASAMVDTRCCGTCGTQSAFYWTLTEQEYLLAFGHHLGQDGPAASDGIDSALSWSEHLDREREDNDWTLAEQVGHAQAAMSAAGVPLTGVISGPGHATLTTDYWVVGWDHERQYWKPLARIPFDDEVAAHRLVGAGAWKPGSAVDIAEVDLLGGCPAGKSCTGMAFPGHPAHEIAPEGGT